jgi:hypothetical protein
MERKLQHNLGNQFFRRQALGYSNMKPFEERAIYTVPDALRNIWNNKGIVGSNWP